MLWYDPARIYVFTREEVAWIIREARDGWPSRPGGYTDTREDVMNGSRPHAMPGQAALDVTAEVDARLDSCGLSGRALADELRAPDRETMDLSLYERFRVYLSQPARDALNYASGARRRRMPFARWLRERDRILREKRRFPT